MGLFEPHGRYRARDGQAALSERAGRLLGIARKARPRGPVEALGEAAIGLATGVTGDCRGVRRPGSSGKRQVTMFALADWEAALAELGAEAPWTRRRCNLLIDGLVLPRTLGTRIRVGETAEFEVTGECDPCRRMDEVVPGLFRALMPEWRGGILTRVLAEGEVRVGDPVVIVAS